MQEPAKTLAESMIDLSEIDRIVESTGREPRHVIPILQAIQSRFNYLPRIALERVVETTDITATRLMGVATFYSQFRLRPAGEHAIRVCHGTACHVKGAQDITDAIYRLLKIPEGDDTDSERRFTVHKVACLGCCTLAPAMQIGDRTYGHLQPDTVGNAIDDYLSSIKRGKKPEQNKFRHSTPSFEIRIGLGSCCVARGSGDVYEAFENAIAQFRAPAIIKRVGCVGMCHQTPIVEVVEDNKRKAFYTGVTAEDAKKILLQHYRPTGMLAKISLALESVLDQIIEPPSDEKPSHYPIDVRDPEIESFLFPQTHIVLEHCGHLDPLDLDDYLSRDGFKSLEKTFREFSPDEVINTVKESGQRGRGGAGFPTGVKWQHVKDASGTDKRIICNGDEGDPGAFMDRMLLESYPYRIIEGMAIAAYAIGAAHGVLYIREEYPLAVKRIREALKRCEERGFLGDNILGTGNCLNLSIMEGAGAFVCGEETALIASIEGKRGTPRLRPPYPAQSGLNGLPTLVNNVETYANIPWIIRNGAAAFASEGTESSRGTKVFALAGKIVRGGLIEVPMGITVRDVVEKIGGGVPGGKTFKAVQVGGPSGGCIPAHLSDTPIDYEELVALGSIMGSGGLVVLDNTDCMVEISRYFLEFTQDQSCGRCTFCRVGTRRMLDILERLTQGKASAKDLDSLEELAHQVKAGSLCGLGQTAPNPVLSTLTHFREEYEAHLHGKCPAGQCKALISYTINDKCIGCMLCARNCPTGAIKPDPYRKHEIDQNACVRCGACFKLCPEKAVEVS